MALTLPADAGEPLSAVLIASAKVRHHEFPALTRQVSLRNTGTNTLWLSLDDGQSWFDVACGTSWDDRVSLRDLWYCTQLGKTRFVVIGLALMSTDPSMPMISAHGAPTSTASTRAPARLRPAKKKRRWLPSRAGREQR
jgi:hypothetical protein